MILFIFEGRVREPVLYSTLQTLFFPKSNEHIVCSFGNNIYQLYSDLQEYDGDGDVVRMLMEKSANNPDNPFKDIESSSAFAEVYLFFDYDFHNTNLPIETLNAQVEELLHLFNDETGYGKLYINYPMVESIRYTQQLPDPNYIHYHILRSDCNLFKNRCSDFSAYKSFDFIQVDRRKELSDVKLEKLKQNWQHLKEQNVGKANYLCNGEYSYPISKEMISQDLIFKHQLSKFVLTDPSQVSILNAFPLFLYDYFK